MLKFGQASCSAFLGGCTFEIGWTCRLAEIHLRSEKLVKGKRSCPCISRRHLELGKHRDLEFAGGDLSQIIYEAELKIYYLLLLSFKCQ